VKRSVVLSRFLATCCMAVAFVASACAGTAPVAPTPAAGPTPASTGQLIFVGTGGSYQQGQDEAFLKPFSTASHVQITEGTGVTIDRVRAEVQSGHPQFDVTVFNQANYGIGVQNDLWEPIDYAQFNPDDIKAMPDFIRLKYAVGTIYYANNVVFNTQKFPDGQPQPNSWADFWDVQKFPGMRALPNCSHSNLTNLPEAALLADGVPMDKLYPLDMQRATKKLQELSPNVIWYSDSTQAAVLVANGDAVMSLAANGRAQDLIDKAAPLKIVWNQARRTYDVMVVLKGSPNVADAMKFIAFASRPEAQAQLAKLTGYAPTNDDAYKFLDDATAKKMVTYPENNKGTFQKDENWWQQNSDKWVETCSSVLGS
jgi:putative spermidine/putrescine transport system substrate-binding protein